MCTSQRGAMELELVAKCVMREGGVTTNEHGDAWWGWGDDGQGHLPEETRSAIHTHTARRASRPVTRRGGTSIGDRPPPCSWSSCEVRQPWKSRSERSVPPGPLTATSVSSLLAGPLIGAAFTAPAPVRSESHAMGHVAAERQCCRNTVKCGEAAMCSSAGKGKEEVGRWNPERVVARLEMAWLALAQGARIRRAWPLDPATL